MTIIPAPYYDHSATRLTSGREHRSASSGWTAAVQEQSTAPPTAKAEAKIDASDDTGHPFIRLVREQERIKNEQASSVSGSVRQSSGSDAPAASTHTTAAVVAPPATPRPLNTTMPTLNIPTSFQMGHTSRLQAVLQQQMWADEYNARIQWEYEHQKYNYDINVAEGDFRMIEPQPPIFQTTDPLEIAQEFDRLEPAGSFMLSYEQVLALAGGTGYQAVTRGEGRTDAYLEMQSRLLQPQVRA